MISDFTTILNMFGQLFSGWISIMDGLYLVGSVSLLDFLLGLAIVSTFIYFVFRSISFRFSLNRDDTFRLKHLFKKDDGPKMGFHPRSSDD